MSENSVEGAENFVAKSNKETKAESRTPLVASFADLKEKTNLAKEKIIGFAVEAKSESEELDIESKPADTSPEKRGLKAQITKTRHLIGKRNKDDLHVPLDNDLAIKRDQLSPQQRRVLYEKEAEEFGELIADYQDTLQDLFEDGTAVRAVGEAYIGRHITPVLDTLTEQGELDPQLKEQFSSALQKIYDEKIDNPKERKALLQAFSDHASLYKLREHFEALEQGIDFRGVNELVSYLFVKEAGEITSEASKIFPARNLLRNGGEIKLMFPPRLYEGSRTDDLRQAYTTLFQPNLGTPENVDASEYKLLQSVRSEGPLHAVLGDEIAEIDHIQKEYTLAAALSDHEGMQIDRLVEYPDPEVLRTIMVLSLAISDGYKQIHARDALDTISTQSDWPALLEETAAKYPEFASVIPVLRSWNTTAHAKELQEAFDAIAKFGNPTQREEVAAKYPEFATGIPLLGSWSTEATLEALQTAADPLLVSLVDSQFANQEASAREKELGKIAMGGLTSTALLDTVARHGIIAEEDASVLKEAESILKEINKKYYAADRRDLYPNMVNQELFSRMVTQEVKNLINKTLPGLRDVDAYTTLAQKIVAEQENIQVVEYMTSLDLLRNLDSLPSEARVRALDAYKSCPALLTDDDVRRFFCDEVPLLAFATEESTKFFSTLVMQGPGAVDDAANVSMGEKVFSYGDIDAKKVMHGFSDIEISKMNALPEESELHVDASNWRERLISFLYSQDEINTNRLSPNVKEKLARLFNDADTKEICLTGMREEWRNYLEGGKKQGLPFTIQYLVENIEENPGPLTHIETLSLFVHQYKEQLQKGQVSQEDFERLGKLEQSFANDRWSNDDRTNFYAISEDLLATDTDLFSKFLGVFDQLHGNDLKKFIKEIYPLYRIKLSLLETDNEQEGKDAIKQTLTEVQEKFATTKAPGSIMESDKKKITEEFKNLFQGKFGITKLPEEFTEQHTRSIKNMGMYLSNIYEKDSHNEGLIGFYLALELNDMWDDFRKGKEIDPSTLLSSEPSEEIADYLRTRKRYSPFFAEALQIEETDVQPFTELLQGDTEQVAIGDIETIDVKLTSVIQNLKGLEDLDLYPDPIDRQRMSLLLERGTKLVGASAAKYFQQLKNPSKQISLSEDELAVQLQMAEILQGVGVEVSPEAVKSYFQEGMKPLATSVNLMQFIDDTQAEGEIESFREHLKPTEAVHAIFTRLGEDFTPTSGAIAVSQDLDYLDSIVVKKDAELADEEKVILKEYIGTIRDRMGNLQEVYDKIKAKYSGMVQGSGSSQNPLLQEKLAEIDSIINTESSLQVITSKMTHDMDVIIENIRECLSCRTPGSNNDTNLTFGDSNKFYLYSQSEASKGSVSDQVVFVDPVRYEGGPPEISFILDRVYGMSTPSIFINQTEVVLKKLKELKRRFPEANLTIFVPESSIRTGGMHTQTFIEKMRDKHGDSAILTASQGNVDVSLSAGGDHYVEFGGSPRSAGPRDVSGVTLRLPSDQKKWESAPKIPPEEKAPSRPDIMNNL